jgi:sugar-phosphatase
VTARWAAVLFDVDGVLLDSEVAHRAVYREWARRRGLDQDLVHATTQGRRRVDALQILVPDRPIDEEHRLLNELMAGQEQAITAYPGAADILAGVATSALVSSSRRSSAEARFRRLGLQLPDVRVFGEDVTAGKPSPEGYLAAAAVLDVDPAECLVIEDSPAGVDAGRAAGCMVYAVASTQPPSELGRAHEVFASLAEVAGRALLG